MHIIIARVGYVRTKKKGLITWQIDTPNEHKRITSMAWLSGKGDLLGIVQEIKIRSYYQITMY